MSEQNKDKQGGAMRGAVGSLAEVFKRVQSELSDALERVQSELGEAFQRVQTELNEAFQRIENELGLLKQGDAAESGQPDKTTQEFGLPAQIEAKKVETETKSVPIKVTLAGYGAVGKTTIFKLLKGKGMEMSYFPTIGANVGCEDLSIGNHKINVWDIAGQAQYHRTWPIFLRNTRIALIVTDSTKDNVEKSRNVISITKSIAPEAILVGIANKQDLPNALPPKEVESILGIKTFPCVAIDSDYREKMIAVIESAITQLEESELAGR